jgi:hypothetical protein
MSRAMGILVCIEASNVVELPLRKSRVEAVDM